MGPAIALRLRQHLTLTPQVQQALRLLQMSALEFAQEMDEALTANPFLEENPDAPQSASRAHPPPPPPGRNPRPLGGGGAATVPRSRKWCCRASRPPPVPRPSAPK